VVLPQAAMQGPSVPVQGLSEVEVLRVSLEGVWEPLVRVLSEGEQVPLVRVLQVLWV
jgi:hypothetical protein